MGEKVFGFKSTLTGLTFQKRRKSTSLMKRCKTEKNKACSAFFYLNLCFTKTENSAGDKRKDFFKKTVVCTC